MGHSISHHDIPRFCDPFWCSHYNISLSAMTLRQNFHGEPSGEHVATLNGAISMTNGLNACSILKIKRLLVFWWFKFLEERDEIVRSCPKPAQLCPWIPCKEHPSCNELKWLSQCAQWKFYCFRTLQSKKEKSKLARYIDSIWQNRAKKSKRNGASDYLLRKGPTTCVGVSWTSYNDFALELHVHCLNKIVMFQRVKKPISLSRNIFFLRTT